MPTAHTIIDALAEWVGSQRWFAGGGMHPKLALIASIPLQDGAEIRVRDLIVSEDGGGSPVLYQMPIVLRRTLREGSDVGFIGTVRDDDENEWSAYDGPADLAFTTLLLALLVKGGTYGDGDARAFAAAGAQGPYGTMSSTVLRGEQSNTSIVYSNESGAPLVICKIFRMLHHGDNPDVLLQSALSAAGSRSVPSIVGSVTGEWPDESRPTGTARGHLAFAQAYVVGAEDGWKRALTAVSGSTEFAEDARRIGVATADVHATLASGMPTREATKEDIARTVIAWHQRLNAAIAEVPELEPTRTAIEALYSRAESATWPRLQRIHGDLHLGQLLATPDGAWTIIDFEGEPMRPLAERSRLDVPLRDIAGMLRSIDYAAGSRTASAGVRDWARSCRIAFLDGYIDRSGNDVRQDSVLLDAFELDKALYEVVYEARNRQAWLPIPVAAVRRLAKVSPSDY